MKKIEQCKERLLKKNAFDGSLVFGTKVFNKKTNRDDHIERASQQVRDFFLDTQTGLLHEHMAKYRDCPICGGNKFDTLFIKEGFRHVKCSCGFILVNPTANDKFRNYFFSEIYQTWTEVLLSPEQELVDTRKFQYGLDFIASHANQKGFLVDIGAGSGLFLKMAQDSGWRVSGIEFNRKAVENIRRLGIEVFDQPLEDGVYDHESTDVVCIWEVLEHINHPDGFIRMIRDILKPEGLLFVCVPNINALVTRILQEKSRTFGGHSHVNFFSIETLSRLLEKYGLEVVETDTVISELGTIKNHLSYDYAYSGDAKLEMSFLTPEYLYANNLGSRIFLLGKKL